ncbi:MAG TPA: carbamoyltransferase C-terminal domain-containing protein [Vicinamibacterales bacterium]|nr:carbamoyltransferase C-terminal domain-containing protein [Vicinamibacterales bacterium]
MLIVGFNAYHGDVAAAVLRDGQLIAALEEERFARVKHVAGFPRRAIAEALSIAGARPADVDIWAVARGRRVHLLRKAWFALTHRPGRALREQYRSTAAHSRDLPAVIGDAFGLDVGTVSTRLRHVEHHTAHLASAYYPSGMTDAACCAIDGFGDFVSMSAAHGTGTSLRVLDRVFFPHSIGLLYLAITQFLGFKHYGDEYKVMGLAPYGTPAFEREIAKLIALDDDRPYRLKLEYFSHWTGDVRMTWEGGEPTIPDVFTHQLTALLGPPRQPDDVVTDRHCDIAASVQRVFESAVFHTLRAVHQRVPVERLCLAGGCAMNSVANGKIRTQTPFREIFIQPAAGDNGTALGAALHAWHADAHHSPTALMEHSYWGTAYEPDAIAAVIRDSGAVAGGGCTWSVEEDEERLCELTAAAIAAGGVIGWYQQRMEWGARALGNRSILADPRRADMRDIINVKIKFRERFRPFAPSILAEAVDDYFVDAVHDPFMIQVYPVRPDKRDRIPAVTHVDGSGRLQSVSERSNRRYWRLLHAFNRLTGVPVLLNTSFNENEPIVEHPSQALACFLRTDMDVLVMGPHVLRKSR